MIIDAHTHIAAAGRTGPFNLPCGAADLLKEMDAHGVDMSVVLPLPGAAPNNFVFEACAPYRDRLVPLYMPDYDQPADTIRLLDERYEEFGFKGLKIHPREQGISVAEPLVLESLHWSAEKDLPVLFDVFPWGARLDDPAIAPLAYHRMAQKLPELRFIMAHAGGHKVNDAFLVAKSNPNCYIDISFTLLYFRGASVANDLRFVCERLPAERLIYGSDFPYVRFDDYLDTTRAVLEGLDDDRQAMIMGDSAAKVFGLGG